MDAVLPYRGMAYNNGWANHRLLVACERLSQADFTAPRTGFFPSLARDAQSHPDRRSLLRGRHGGRHARAGSLREPGAVRNRGRAANRAGRGGPAADRRRRPARHGRSRPHRRRPPRQSHPARADGPVAAASVSTPDPPSRSGARHAQRHRRAGRRSSTSSSPPAKRPLRAAEFSELGWTEDTGLAELRRPLVIVWRDPSRRSGRVKREPGFYCPVLAMARCVCILAVISANQTSTAGRARRRASRNNDMKFFAGFTRLFVSDLPNLFLPRYFPGSMFFQSRYFRRCVAVGSVA